MPTALLDQPLLQCGVALVEEAPGPRMVPTECCLRRRSTLRCIRPLENGRWHSPEAISIFPTAPVASAPTAPCGQ